MRSRRCHGIVLSVTILGLLLGTQGLAWAQCWGQEAKQSGYANPHLLLSTQELADHLADPTYRIVDLRGAGPRGFAEYRKGHIPGAVYVNWLEIDDLAANRKGFPISLAKAEALFSKLGIDQNTRVVAYDDGGGLFAARLLFVLEFFGHERVAVLNGGIRKWAKEGRPFATNVPLVKPTRFVAKPNPERIATAEWVKANLKNPRVKVVDARTDLEYAGKRTHPGKEQDPDIKRGGHIPGAIHVNWVETINRTDGTFKSAEELKQLFAEAGVTEASELVTYCRTGVRAAHDYFVARLLGYEKVRNYDGSWIDWGNRPELPLEK